MWVACEYRKDYISTSLKTKYAATRSKITIGLDALFL